MNCSTLPIWKINKESVHELMVAYQLNLISTQRIRDAVKVLYELRLTSESDRLRKFIGQEFSKRMKFLKNTHMNAQNVHLDSIQNSTEYSIKFVMSKPKPSTKRETLIDEAVTAMECDKELSDKICSIALGDVVHPKFKVTFYDIFARVYQIIVTHENRSEILPILREEIKTGFDTCLTGLLTRMLVAMCGFVPEIRITISSREELSNSILAIRRSHAVKYGNTEEYTHQVVPAVWQMLEDFCVPDGEHMDWLEYL